MLYTHCVDGTGAPHLTLDSSPETLFGAQVRAVCKPINLSNTMVLGAGTGAIGSASRCQMKINVFVGSAGRSPAPRLDGNEVVLGRTPSLRSFAA